MDACSTVEEARKCRKEGWRRGESKIDCVFGHLAAARESRLVSNGAAAAPLLEMNRAFSRLKFDH